jgi:hypothetical protein
MGHAVQPVGDHRAGHDGIGPANEDEKRSLKSVLGIVVVGKDSTTHAPHHRAVPPHQRFEGRLITVADEALQQIPIAPFRSLRMRHGSAKVLENLVQGVRHLPLNGWYHLPPILLLPGHAGLIHFFFDWARRVGRRRRHTRARGGPTQEAHPTSASR